MGTIAIIEDIFKGISFCIREKLVTYGEIKNINAKKVMEPS